MKRNALLCAATIAGALAAAMATRAGAESGTITVVRDDGPTGFSGQGQAGEFGVRQFDGMTLPPSGQDVSVGDYAFQTFCLEANETIVFDRQYQWSLGVAAHGGGAGGAVNGEDPISAATAYLYAQFWTGTLSDYDYLLGSGRIASASSLQRAFWVLEEEISESSLDAYDQARVWIAEARTATGPGGAWTVRFGAGSIGDVRVLTLTDSFGNPQQDVLVVVPPNSPPPPPPPPTVECGDFFTGGGFLFETPSGRRANFGVGGGFKKGAFWGHLNLIDHGTKMHVKGRTVTGYEVVSDLTRRSSGTCTIDGVPGTYVLEITDNGEPGRNDVFTLRLSNGYVASGVIDGGNLQLHKSKCRARRG
jgi:hypothetical protein